MPKHKLLHASRPKVCLGMPLYNQTEFLTEALQSLLEQTYADFRLVIVDDSTESEPGNIANAFADRDNRIRYIKNASRKGLVDNWRACFLHAGNIDYFGWVGDHDVWHPEWLESMVRALNDSPNAVLAYPKKKYINPDGETLEKKKKAPFFSTEGLTAAGRIKAVYRDARGFGKMVYGLFRADALQRAGVFRRLLYPDVILLFEMCLQGDFKQVDRELWYLRRVADFSIRRQKKSLFIRQPWYLLLPWPFVNAAALAWNTAVRPSVAHSLPRYFGFRMAIMYLFRYIGKLGKGSWIGSYYEWSKGKKPWMKKLRASIKRYKQNQRVSGTKR